ncbi:MAG: P-II family nitrogen regulator [Nitrosopumilaceae archaeon]
MKRIEVVVGKTTAHLICDALKEAGFTSFMSTSVRGRGKIRRGVYVHGDRASPMKSIDELILDKSKLEIILDDKDMDKVTSIIINTAKSATMVDGKIFISDVDKVIRIRDGESGPSAV